MATPRRPSITRQPSRVPGGFDTDDDLSPIKSSLDDEAFEQYSAPPQSQATTVMGPPPGDDSLLEDARSPMAGEGDTYLQEKEMRRQLEDVDSTFLPEVSPAARSRTDSSLLSQPHPNSTISDLHPETSKKLEVQSTLIHDQSQEDEHGLDSPATPPDMYQTPAPGRSEVPSRNSPDTAIDHGHYNTSSLETMSSSPTAAAAARTVSRAVSMASMDGGYETADDSKGGILLEDAIRNPNEDHDTTPRKSHRESVSSRTSSPTPTKTLEPQERREAASGDRENGDLGSTPSRKRPKFLNSRMASQRSSYSSYTTTTSTEGGSDLTLGADYALQSGGAVPSGGSLSSRPVDYTRSISLGSMASGISDLSDREDRIRPIDEKLHTLDEEEATIQEDTLRGEDEIRSVPQTPTAASARLNTPTDTVIGQRVRDIEVRQLWLENTETDITNHHPKEGTVRPRPRLAAMGRVSL